MNRKLADFYKEKASLSTRFKTALKFLGKFLCSSTVSLGLRFIFLEGVSANETHTAIEFLEKDHEAVFGVLQVCNFTIDLRLFSRLMF